MATVLVTGASGFIGGHLAESLVRRGDHVRCLVRSSSQIPELQAMGAELVVGDLRDVDSIERAVRGTDVVYHVAGITTSFNRAAFEQVNERGTDIVASACARQSTSPVHLYVSSIAAGGPTQSGKQRIESEPSNPVSNYGRSKLAGELAAAKYAGAVPTTIVRPGIVLGPRNRECLPIFETIDRSGIHPVAGFRSPALSFIHVNQLIDLFFRAVRSGTRLQSPQSDAIHTASGCYHASLDDFPNYAEFGRLIARALGRSQAFVFPIAMPFPFIAAGVNELISRFRGRPDHFNIDKIREANVGSWACSSALAQRELGFRPSGTLADQLPAIVEWYREAGWLRTRPLKRAPALSRLSTTHSQAAP